MILPVSETEKSDRVLLPYLWTGEGIHNLARFERHFYLAAPNTTPEAEYNIVALKDEASVRRTLRKIQHFTPTADNRIFSAEQLDFETETGVLMKSQLAERWLEIKKDEALEFPEALAIARDALQSLHTGEISQSQWNIEKEELRQRCGLNSFDWNKYIADLEAEIHAVVDGLPKLAGAEKLKLELSAYLRVTDPFVQEVERNRICSTYRVKDKTFERLCQVLRIGENTSAQKPRPLSLKEAFTLESEALSWLVPGLLPNKVSALLSGLPGSGKSLLTVDLAWAIVTGGKFLGEQCKKGKVLLINSDQPLNMTVNYLSDRGFDETEENLQVIGASGDLSAWTIRDLELLEQWLDDYKPNLVVIDSIRTAVCYPLGLEEKSEQVGHWMKEVERLVTRHGSLLWVHHDNKDPQKKGVARASGSTAIPGNVSVHWQVEAVSTDSSKPFRRLNTPKTRGFEPSTLNIEFKPHTGEWELVSRAGEAEALTAEKQSIKDKILKLLLLRPGVGMEAVEIRNAIGSDSAYKVLSRMADGGIISKRKSKTNGSRVYFLPDSKEPSPPQSPQTLSSTEAESIDTNTFEVTGHLLDTLLDTYWTPNESNQPVQSEKADTVIDSAIPDTLPGQGGEGESLAVANSPVNSTDCRTWTPGTKFRSTSQHRSYKKYLDKTLVVKQNNLAGCTVSAEGTRDEFAYGSIELIDP